jgi:hypothetical protein
VQRTSLIVGAILVAAGLFTIVRGVTYTRDESVFKLGDFEANLRTERRVPEWIGGVALGAGLVLIVLGVRKR